MTWPPSRYGWVTKTPGPRKSTCMRTWPSRKLNERGVRFATLRMRSASLMKHIRSLDPSDFTTITAAAPSSRGLADAGESARRIAVRAGCRRPPAACAAGPVPRRAECPHGAVQLVLVLFYAAGSSEVRAMPAVPVTAGSSKPGSGEQRPGSGSRAGLPRFRTGCARHPFVLSMCADHPRAEWPVQDVDFPPTGQ